MPELEAVDRLISEVVEIIPAFTSGRGSFNTVPQLGYAAKNPGDWQREFLEQLDGQYLHGYAPDTHDVLALVGLLNEWTVQDVRSKFTRPDGSISLVPTSTLATLLGYALIEMLVRRLLLPGGARDPGHSSIDQLLRRFVKETRYPELARHITELNRTMKSKELTGTYDLFGRIKRGRDLLMHGNVLRTLEPEGWLLALLVDLIVLHVMRSEMTRNFVYVAHVGYNDLALSILDASDPENPKLVRQIPKSRNAHRHKVQIVGNVMIQNSEFISDVKHADDDPPECGVIVYNLDDPTDPKRIAFYNVEGRRGVHRMWFRDMPYAHLSAQVRGATQQGSQVIDLSDPYTRRWPARGGCPARSRRPRSDIVRKIRESVAQHGKTGFVDRLSLARQNIGSDG